MSRRASLFSKENPGKERTQVRFPDELVFLDNIKENDMEATYEMLRTASVTMDINSLGDSGMTPLHQAVLDDNMAAVRLLLRHGADVNKTDEDTWTPLHAACSEGHTDIVRFLLAMGADKTAVTDDSERPIDLVDSQDFQTIAVMLSHGRCSPPPARPPDGEDGEEEEGEEEEVEEEEDDEVYQEENSDDEDDRAPVFQHPVPLPPAPARSCLKKSSASSDDHNDQ